MPYKNIEDRRKADKRYYEKYKDKVCARTTKYYWDNIEQSRKLRREYKKIYDKYHKEERNQYERIRRMNDIQYKLTCVLRERLRGVLKRTVKTGSAVKDLGCSVSELKKHLENKFTKGMSWNNYGNGKNQWSIDHIKPLSKFDLTKRDNLLEACHYTNLQPMWQIDNVKKSNKEGALYA